MFTFPTTFMSAAAANGITASVQEVEITVATGETSNTATISAVNTDNSIVILNWQRTTSTLDDADHIYFAVELTDSTTVTASRGVANGEYTIVATVIEYTAAAINNIQHGSITMTGDLTGTDTISSVDTAASTVIFRGFTSTEAGSGLCKSNMSTVSLTNATTVTAERGSILGGDSRTIFYTVLEFASGIVDSIQEVEITVSDPALSDTATISSVDTSVSVLFPGGWRAGASAGANTHSPQRAYTALTNATTVTATRGTAGASAADATIIVTVVEFASGNILSIQRSTVTLITTDTTKDVTITSVNTSKSAAVYLGHSDDDPGTVEPEDQFVTVKLLDATTLRFERGTTSAFTEVLSWEVWEY